MVGARCASPSSSFSLAATSTLHRLTRGPPSLPPAARPRHGRLLVSRAAVAVPHDRDHPPPRPALALGDGHDDRLALVAHGPREGVVPPRRPRRRARRRAPAPARQGRPRGRRPEPLARPGRRRARRARQELVREELWRPCRPHQRVARRLVGRRRFGDGVVGGGRRAAAQQAGVHRRARHRRLRDLRDQRLRAAVHQLHERGASRRSVPPSAFSSATSTDARPSPSCSFPARRSSSSSSTTTCSSSSKKSTRARTSSGTLSTLASSSSRRSTSSRARRRSASLPVSRTQASLARTTPRCVAVPPCSLAVVARGR